MTTVDDWVFERCLNSETNLLHLNDASIFLRNAPELWEPSTREAMVEAWTDSEGVAMTEIGSAPGMALYARLKAGWWYRMYRARWTEPGAGRF